MGLQQTHQRLTKMSNNLMEEFKANFFSDTENELSLVSKFIKVEGDSFEFQFLGRTFVLIRDIMPYGNLVLYRTNEVLLDYNNYPNTKLNPIVDLDIVQHLQGYIRFAKKKTMNHSFFGENYDVTIIQNFGVQYVTQIAQIIMAREIQAYKEFEQVANAN